MASARMGYSSAMLIIWFLMGLVGVGVIGVKPVDVQPGFLHTWSQVVTVTPKNFPVDVQPGCFYEG
jgi:hypothetical protein